MKKLNVSQINPNNYEELKRTFGEYIKKKFNEHCCPPGFVCVDVVIRKAADVHIEPAADVVIGFELKKK